MSNSGYTSDYEYDNLGRLLKETLSSQGDTKIKEYTRNSKGTIEYLYIKNPDGEDYKVRYSNIGIPTSSANKAYGCNKFPINKKRYTIKNEFQDLDAAGKDQILRTRTWYDELCRIKEVQLPYGGKYKWEYDYKNRPLKLINPDLSEELLDFDDENRIITYTNTSGNKSKSTYDAFDRLIKTTAPNNAVVETIYDDFNSKITVMGVDGQKSIEYFADLGRSVKVETYNSSKSEVLVTEKQYDKLDRLTYVFNRTANIESNGEVGELSVEKLNIYHYEYDGLDRLVRVTDPLLQVSEYKYNHLDEIIETKVNGETDPNDQTKQIEYINKKNYDVLGRLIESIDEKGKKKTFTYDNKGNLVQEIDKAGQITDFTYDLVMNRLESIGNSDEKFDYSYTNLGNIKSINYYPDKNELSNVNVTQYSYHDDGMLKSKKVADGKSIDYAYDNAGNVSQITDYLGVD